jgi:hypothetical protein
MKSKRRETLILNLVLYGTIVTSSPKSTRKFGDLVGMMLFSEAAYMTLLVFFGVVVSLLILRSIPGLLLRVVLAIPRQRLLALVHRAQNRRIGIAFSAPAPSGGRWKLVLVSSSLLVLVMLVTTAFWSTHSAFLMTLLQ